THLVWDIRPQPFRHRIDTPSLRGVNIQRLFGSQRALKSVEDFTEFEQRAAYFDGDPVTATKKGVNILERGSQVHFMAEFQELLDGRLLTLEDTVEFFNVVLGVKLSEAEKKDLVAFLRCL